MRGAREAIVAGRVRRTASDPGRGDALGGGRPSRAGRQSRMFWSMKSLIALTSDSSTLSPMNWPRSVFVAGVGREQDHGGDEGGDDRDQQDGRRARA